MISGGALIAVSTQKAGRQTWYTALFQLLPVIYLKMLFVMYQILFIELQRLQGKWADFYIIILLLGPSDNDQS